VLFFILASANPPHPEQRVGRSTSKTFSIEAMPPAFAAGGQGHKKKRKKDEANATSEAPVVFRRLAL
jgi:hypothetical protein